MTSDRKPDGYWTKERCFEEAKKYEYKSDFKTKSRGAYSASVRHKWLKEFNWLKRKTPSNKYWTKERCFEEAKKYSSKVEFKKEASSAYLSAIKNKWIDDYIWFKRPSLITKWTKEETEKEARKYNIQSEFQKNSPSAFSAAWRNGWLEEYDWFIEISKPAGYWTKEKCKEEALKYKTRTEFQKKSGSAYTAAWRNGWLDDVTVHMKKRTYDTSLYSDKKYVIYIYKDEENKVAYVGLTNNINRRHREHTSLKNEEYDTVGNYFGTNVSFPDILFKDLSAEDAMQKEEELYHQYKNAGWTMLNDETKLGTIGSAHQKWTKNKCKKEALKYKTLKDFREKSNIAYDTALKNDWTKEYTWLEREQHSWWSKDECFEEAKKYNSRKEFEVNSPGAYNAANRNDWLKDYTWFKRPDAYNKKWTEEVCENEAKKFNTTKDFMNSCPGAYSAASRNGWLKNYTWLIKQNREPWTYEECYEIAKQLTTLKEFRTLYNKAYIAAQKNDWLKDFIWLKYKRTSKTEEECFNEAKKYKYLKDFRECSNSAYCAAQKHKWIEEYTWLIRKRK